jgi:hypothetical protein
MNGPDELTGCCGLYCGLCSKYQSKSPSRCTGCRKGEQHSYCSIWNCCVKKHGFAMCTDCDELFKCPIFIRRKVQEWIPAHDNLNHILKAGLKNWLKEQKERLNLLEELLRDYNEGRSMSFYCKACSRMPVKLIRIAIREAEEKLASEKANRSDIKEKAKALKTHLSDLAFEANVRLD